MLSHNKDNAPVKTWREVVLYMLPLIEAEGLRGRPVADALKPLLYQGDFAVTLRALLCCKRLEDAAAFEILYDYLACAKHPMCFRLMTLDACYTLPHADKAALFAALMPKAEPIF